LFLTPEQIETIRQVRENSGSYRDAAKAAGCAPSTVGRYFPDSKLNEKSEDPDGDLAKLIPLLKKSPLKLEEIAGRAGVSKECAAAWLAFQQTKGVNLCCFDGHYSIEDVPPPSCDTPVFDFVSEKDNSFLFGACGDQHLCFPPNTPIRTNRGDVRISQIQPGDAVLTHRGRYRRVIEKVVSPGDGKLIRIWFTGKPKDGQKSSGQREKASLVCTPNHPVRIIRNGAQGWLPASEIRAGDAVIGAGKPCKYCPKLVPEWMSVCHEHDPFVRSADRRHKVAQRRKQASQASQSTHYHRDVIPEMDRWWEDGWRVIPVDKVRPDFIAIRDGKVVAVEVESPQKNRPMPVYEKYDYSDCRKHYDEVVWVEKDPRTKKQNRKYDWIDFGDDQFIGFVVTSVEQFSSRPTGVFNLIVEEDESYVAKRCVVHNCSKYERLDVLEDYYRIYADAGITRVFNTGNWIDGEARFNKFDLKVHGMGRQLEYLANHYPVRPGITTWAVSGDDHEGWYGQREGVDIGKHSEYAMREAGRTDWRHLGFIEANVRLVNANTGKSSFLTVMHPGGGTAYAISYQPQKIVECVPLNSEALTRNGWAKPGDLKVGDEIMGYDLATDQCQWTKITALNLGRGLVHRYFNDQFDVQCTPNHRWAMEWESRAGRNPNSKVPVPYSRRGTMCWTIDESKERSRIIQAAPCPDGPGLSTWGHQEWLRRDLSIKRVLSMKSGERRAFIEGLLCGEGTVGETRGYRTVVFSQNRGPVLDAFRLACFLEGIATTCRLRPGGTLKPGVDHHCAATLLNKRMRNVSSLKKEILGEQDVWCPTTELGTWVMRQGDLITITGNSLEGGEKPAVMLLGHYHKLSSNNVRNVWVVQTGCSQDQTPFMKKKRIDAHIGALIIKMHQDPETGAITRFMPDMIRYFNKGYYGNRRWSYDGEVDLPARM